MTIGRRIYWVLALVALLPLTGAAATMASRFTSAGSTAAPAALLRSCV